MLQLVTSVTSAVYLLGGLLFLFNCSAERVEKGERPGTLVLLVALTWPAMLLAALIHITFATWVHATDQ